MYIVLAIVVFSVLIMIHEFGHFITAKLFHVQVNEFSVFMGPKLLQHKGKETSYTLRLIPIGGYCAMEGEDEESDNPRAFTAQKPWKRAVILVAGAFMNYLLGLLLVLCIYSSAAAFTEPVIDHFFEGCPYESEQGFQAGDRILSIDGKRVNIYDDVSLLLDRNSTGVFDFTLLRDGKKVALNGYELKLVPYEVDGETEYRYGFYFGAKEATVFTHFRHAWYEGIYFTRMVWMGLADLVSGKVGLKDMSGPVAIVAVMSDSGKAAGNAADGILNVLYLGAFIAVNLAVMNMLPIPALDGGRVFLLVVTCIIEAITGKKIDPKYEGVINTVGMVLLLGLMAFVLFHDIFRLVT